MQIYFQAFAWTSKCTELPISAFIQMLTSDAKPIKIKNRNLYIHKKNGIINGLLITIKDMKKFCKIIRQGGNIKLTAHTLANNENVADFNFFTFDENMGRGLYQYYHHSCALTAFNTIAKMKYRDYLADKKKIELENNQDRAKDKKYLAKMEERFTGYLQTTIIERKGNFIERVKKMKDISNIEFEFDSLEYEQNEFSPIATHIKKSKHSLTLSQSTSKLDKVAATARLFLDNTMRKARVVGLDEEGNDVAYKLMNDFDRFASFEYDDLVPSLSLDSNDVEASVDENEIIKRLHATYSKSALSRAQVK